MILPLVALFLAAGTQSRPPAGFPRWSPKVPPAFRGDWDEKIDDRCRDREARYSLRDDSLDEFEVDYTVRRVRLVDANTIEIHAIIDPEYGPPEGSIWRFTLVRGGRGLKHPGGRTTFLRCPA